MLRQYLRLLVFSAVFCWSAAIAEQHNETATATVCSDQQFSCQDSQNTCIPFEWVCDNVKDCPNGKDEAKCFHKRSCAEGYLLCRNYACVRASLKCDGFDDCQDGSDERGCPMVQAFVERSACPVGMYKCRGGPCIPLRAICDGRMDCPEQDDEEQCAMTFTKKPCNSEYDFTCEKDGSCVPKRWMCDGVVDCADGSDEQFCYDSADTPSVPDLSNCTEEEFRCSGNEKKCISLSMVCNKISDCPGNDDEGGFCGMCSKYGCEHSCVDSPLGPTCHCGAGEEVGDDLKSCVDVNECLKYRDGQPPCAHTCTNTKGSFTCSCKPGFRLAADGRGCSLEEADEGRLLVSFGHEVRKIPLSPRKTNNMSNGSVMANEDANVMIRGLDYSTVDKRVYMTVSLEGGLHGSIHAYHTHQQCLVDQLTGASNVAVDWITGNIYYTASRPSPRPGLGVCTNDGRFCRLLVSDNGTYRFQGLALHPRRGLMFWSAWGRQGPRIEQSSMNGQNRKTLINSNLEWPNGLTIDYAKEHLYFTDAQLQTIERIDILTGRRIPIITVGLHHPFDIAVFHGYLFWTERHIKGVVQTSISNLTDRHVLHSLPQVPYGLAIDHPEYHRLKPGQINPCLQSNCSHMCLLSNVQSGSDPTGMCICPDDYYMQSGRCMPLNVERLRRRHPDRVPQMCMSRMLEFCKEGTACFNGGDCKVAGTIRGKMTSVSCECPSGFGGRYCEVTLNSDQTTKVVN